MPCLFSLLSFFFFNDTATTEIYTLSLHDALPIWCARQRQRRRDQSEEDGGVSRGERETPPSSRSEEHTSELQSHSDLVCRLLLEKKKTSATISYDSVRNSSSTDLRRTPVDCSSGR